MDEIHILYHSCGNPCAVAMKFDMKKQEIVTLAHCPECEQELVICHGPWIDPLFSSVMEMNSKGGEA